MEIFSQLAALEDPQPDSLIEFVDGVVRALGILFEPKHREEFRFLWELDQGLEQQAQISYNEYVKRSAQQLKNAIVEIPGPVIANHGLIGQPLHFKYMVVDRIALQWGNWSKQFSIREWLKKLIDGIDAVLDSILDAVNKFAPGPGGLIKEFKDAIRALC